MSNPTKDQAEELQRRVDANRVKKPPAYGSGFVNYPRIYKYGEVGHPEVVIIDIDPIGAPRQTRRDAWKPSPAVVRYRAWKDKFVPACKAAGWTLGPVFRAEFEIAMPASWSKKKKAAMNGQPHQSRPDWDNCAKACCDAFGTEDSFVWKAVVEKRWAEKGRIILYR